MGDYLIVGVNSDEWLTRKKGRSFLPWHERSNIVQNLSMVDQVCQFDDSDNSACDIINQTLEKYPHSKIIFANGGDRTKDNIPEMSITNPRLEFVFGVGGDNKANSSSEILQEWKTPKTIRTWGYYRILHEEPPHVKLKELVVEPGKQLSMQKHHDRNEFWFVSRGCATVYTVNTSTDLELRNKLKIFENTWIYKNEWHQLTNETDQPLHLIEIQFGDNCVENDIERMSL
jgi:mannose-6-phosphate isomerase-like protein (cupin superfamily)